MGIQQEGSKQWKKGGRKINYHHALATTTSNFFAIWQKEYLPTKKLPGVALVNISTDKLLLEKATLGITFLHFEIALQKIH